MMFDFSYLLDLKAVRPRGSLPRIVIRFGHKILISSLPIHISQEMVEWRVWEGGTQWKHSRAPMK